MIRSVRSIPLLLSLAALHWVAEGATNGTRPVVRPPNVLLILMDDMGYGDIGVHGNKDVRTPAIDRLCAESTRFTRYFTQPVCTPTRASLMTGRYHFRTRAVSTLYGSQMDPDEVTIAEALRAAGYRTGIFGKWHLGDNYPIRALDQGFDEAVMHRGGGMGHFFDRPGSSYFNPVLEHNGESRRYEGYCNDIFFAEAGKFIGRHRDEPFFCFVSTPLVHDPLMVPPELWLPYHERGVNEDVAMIYGMMQNVDENIARLLRQLDELGIADNTIVIFASDNGPAMTLSDHQARFNANLRGEKKQVYEGGIRSPLFIRWPGRFEAGRDIDRIASMVDLFPTLAEACGASIPGELKLDGISLMPLLADSRRSASWPDRSLFFQCYPGAKRDLRPEIYYNCAVRTQRWKLVNGRELYDLQADAAEAHDVAAGNPGIVADLRKQYEAWFADVCATRGFDPPAIILGTPHENPAVLNQRDWRLDYDIPKPTVPGQAARLVSLRPPLMGSWTVTISKAGNYRVQCHLKDSQQAAGELHFQLNDVHVVKPVGDLPGQTVAFDSILLPETSGELRAWYSRADQPREGLLEIEIERL